MISITIRPVSDLRAVRNRGIFALVVIALIAVWFLRLAFRLTGAALALIGVAIVILLALGWITSAARGRAR